MYRIAVLAEEETEGQYYVEQTSRFYSEKGIFPHIVQYQDQECFFENVQKTAPTNVVIAFSGVAGLDMAEHLMHLIRHAGSYGAVIWIFRCTRTDCGQTIFY